jgi:hypothetical protein
MNTVVLSGELDIIQFFYCDSPAVVISRETGSSWRTRSILIHHTGISVYCVLGSSDFDKIFENGYASCSFELAKDI